MSHSRACAGDENSAVGCSGSIVLNELTARQRGNLTGARGKKVA